VAEKRPKFIGLFPSQFPHWGGDGKPYYHHKQARTASGDYVVLEALEEKPCDMAFHGEGSGICRSARFDPLGVAGIDAAGNCWVLVRDNAIKFDTTDRKIGLRWVKFEVGIG